MNKFVAGVVVLLLAAVGAYAYYAYEPKMEGPTGPSGVVSNVNEAAIEGRIVEFGTKLQNVSLLAPDVAAQIQAQYSAYVDPALIASWQADTSKAVGRHSSSPWPDRINIVSITPKASAAAFQSYQVEANVIEIAGSSAGKEVAAVYPVSMTVEKRNGVWMITALSKGAYSQLPQRVSVDGFWECLPHKNTGGPQTMECAFGIAIDQSDGHYAINTTLMSQYPVDFPVGTKVRVSGVLVPANQLSSEQTYDIDGVIQATSIQKI